MIKGIYHTYSKIYPTAKDLGFTHVELGIGAWPGKLELFEENIEKAHALGLGVIAEVGFEKSLDPAMNFLKLSSLNSEFGDIIYLPDEPNLRGFSPQTVKVWNDLSKRCRPDLKTMIVLSDIRTYDGYENCSDYVGVDYYRPFSDLWSLGIQIYKICKLKIKSSKELVAVPAIRGDARNIARQYKFWKFMGLNNFYWYSWSGDGGAFGYTDLLQRQDLMEALKNDNQV